MLRYFEVAHGVHYDQISCSYETALGASSGKAIHQVTSGNRSYVDSVASGFILDNLPELLKEYNIRNTTMRPSDSLYLGTRAVLKALYPHLNHFSSKKISID